MKKNKNILIFSAYILPHIGGVERYLDGMTNEMVRLGYHPTVVIANYDNGPCEEEKNGVRILRLPIFQIFKNRYPIMKYNRKERKILKKLDTQEYEAVIVNTRFWLISHIGAKYGNKRNIPVYLIEHGSNYVTLNNAFIDFFANRYEDFLTWRIRKKITAFYGVSEACNKWLSKLGIKAAGVWYASLDYHNEDLPKRKTTKEGITLMFAGRIIQQKGVDNVLIAFRNLQKKYKNIKLYVAGTGPELEDYKTEYNGSGIKFLGHLKYDDLLKYYAKTDVFVYPPLWPEGCPMAILEAGLMGCATISTPQGGIKEVIVDNENGLMVKSNDICSLQDAMEKLIINTRLRERLAKQLKETIMTKFLWKNTIQTILSDI